MIPDSGIACPIHIGSLSLGMCDVSLAQGGGIQSTNVWSLVSPKGASAVATRVFAVLTGAY